MAHAVDELLETDIEAYLDAHENKSFLRFILTDGQDMANDLDYATLPDELRTKALAQLDELVVPA